MINLSTLLLLLFLPLFTSSFLIPSPNPHSQIVLHSTKSQPRKGPLQSLLDFTLSSPLYYLLLVPQARANILKTAEANGIPWTSSLNWIRSQNGPWKSRSSIEGEFPEYFTQKFHAYRSGNLCWEAAFEQEIAGRAIGVRNFPSHGYDGEDFFRGSFEETLEQLGAASSSSSSAKTQQQQQQRQSVILDFGCGTGTSTRRLARRYPHAQTTIIGLDLSPYYIEVGKTLLKVAPMGVKEDGPWVTTITPDPRIEFVQCDITHTSFSNESADVVNLMFVLHELPFRAAKQVVDEAYRVLKPGGQFWISEMDFESPAYAEQRSNPLLFALVRATEPYLDEYADSFGNVKEYLVEKFEKVTIGAATGRHYALVAIKGENGKKGKGVLTDLRFHEDGSYAAPDTHLKVWESEKKD